MHTYTRIQSTAENDEEQQREDAEFNLYTSQAAAAAAKDRIHGQLVGDAEGGYYFKH